MERRETLCTVRGNVNRCSQDGKQYGDFLKKLKTELNRAVLDPAIPLWGFPLSYCEVSRSNAMAGSLD